ncbi:MAG: Fe-S cluster assembly protein SufB, partial [Sulfurimonadaceae bacterium]
MAQSDVDKIVSQEYKLGFTVDVEEDTVAPGLNDDVIRFISAKKDEPEWMTELRIKALHRWEKMEEPRWAHIHYEPINYQAISYFAAPKRAPNSLDEIDPKVLEAYEKL